MKHRAQGQKRGSHAGRSRGEARADAPDIQVSHDGHPVGNGAGGEKGSDSLIF